MTLLRVLVAILAPHNCVELAHTRAEIHERLYEIHQEQAQCKPVATRTFVVTRDQQTRVYTGVGNMWECNGQLTSEPATREELTLITRLNNIATLAHKEKCW